MGQTLQKMAKIKLEMGKITDLILHWHGLANVVLEIDAQGEPYVSEPQQTSRMCLIEN